MPKLRRPLPKEDPFKDYDPSKGVTFGLLAKWLECKTKAAHQIAGWSGTGFSEPLIYGDLMHNCLQELQVHAQQGAEITKGLVVQHVDEAMQRIQETMGGFWTAEEQQTVEIIKVKAIPVLFVYFEYWSGQHKNIEWEELEGKFDVPFGSVRLLGKRDGVMTMPRKRSKSRTRWLFETKTRGGAFDENLLTTLGRDLQTNIYLLSLWLEKRIPDGILYNEIRRPQLRLKQSETVSEFELRIEEEARNEPEKYFRRIEVAISQEDLKQFRDQFALMVEEFATWARNGRPSYTYGMPCLGKYGACQFLKLCHEGSAFGLRRRTSMFEELAG